MDLILHIGSEKTGSTSLQEALDRNRPYLQRHRVCLSRKLGRTAHSALAYSFRSEIDPALLGLGIRSAADLENYRHKILSDLQDEVSSLCGAFDTMIITSEHFQSRLLTTTEVQALGSYLRGLFSNVRVFVYLRPQVDIRRSLYSTVLRQGYSEDITAFHSCIKEDDPYYNHLKLLERWGSVFGNSNLNALEYSRTTLYQGDIVSDFMNRALPNVELPLPIAYSENNSALGPLEAKMFRWINRLIRYSDGRGNINPWNLRIKRFVSLILKPLPPGENLGYDSPLNLEIERRIASSFAKTNKVVSDQYLSRNTFPNKEIK